MSFVLVIRFSNYVIGQSSVYNSNVDAWSEVVGTRMKNPGWLNQMHPVGEFHICGFHIFSRNSEIPRPSQSERTCQDPVQGRKRILREKVQSDDGKRWFISLRILFSGAVGAGPESACVCDATLSRTLQGEADRMGESREN